jgi:hypothetical protein
VHRTLEAGHDVFRATLVPTRAGAHFAIEERSPLQQAAAW